jgi:hypothetical protein
VAFIKGKQQEARSRVYCTGIVFKLDLLREFLITGLLSHIASPVCDRVKR